MIDLCVFLAGYHLNEYVPLFLETLFRNCDTSNLNIHVVEKGYFRAPITEEEKSDFANGENEVPWYIDLKMKYYVPGVGAPVHDYLLKKKEEVNVPFNIYEMHDANLFFKKSTPHAPFYYMGSDHAETCNWAMENCGDSKWVIFCHLDMIFKNDIVSRLAIEMNDYTGMYGIFNHCFAVNREAFNKVGIKFNDISGFRIFGSKKVGFDYEFSHSSDPSCPKDAGIMFGFDVGELLKIMMIANGWRCCYSNDPELAPYVDHLCSGHGYVNEKTLSDHKSRIENWLKKYAIERI